MKLLKEFKRALSVPLRIHWSAALLPILLVIYNGPMGLAYAVLLLASLLFHEYAHVWMAQRNGIPVSQVIMFALGAAALLDDPQLTMTFRPKIELKIAAAGPISSLLLGFIFLPPAVFCSIYFSGSIISLWLVFMSIISIVLGLFNLLPIYPMDGGRMLNAILSMIFGIRKALNISVIVAYILGTIGLVLSVMYVKPWFIVLSIIVVIFAHIQKKALLLKLNEMGHY